MAVTASRFFGNNLVHLLDDLGGASWNLDFEDEVARKSTVVREGELTWPPPADPPPPPKTESADSPAPNPTIAPPAPTVDAPVAAKSNSGAILALVLAIVFATIGMWAPTEFIQHFTVFVLACFIGWQVVWNVTAALHTPLMSVTNAISGIIIVGGLLQAGKGEANMAAILGAIAILVASINIFGGFLVTQRMLAMFRRDPGAPVRKKKRGH
jgi:NAD(P) transhydrogenase subunit alpha